MPSSTAIGDAIIFLVSHSGATLTTSFSFTTTVEVFRRRVISFGGRGDVDEDGMLLLLLSNSFVAVEELFLLWILSLNTAVTSYRPIMDPACRSTLITP